MPPLYNLVIVFTPRFQDMAHWMAVKVQIDGSAPDIETRIVSNEFVSPQSYRWQAERPSLVFSVFPLKHYRPRNGSIVAATTNLSKIVEISRLAAAGIPVPRTVPLRSDTVLDPAVFGDYLIAKPVAGYQGQGVKLVAIGDLRGRFMELTENLARQMLVQEFIDPELDKGRPVEYRVYTILGRVFCIQRRTWLKPRPPPEAIAANRHAIVATSTPGFSSVWKVFHDSEAAELARKVAPVFPEIPCLGIDMIRRRETGQLYVLEIDSRGTDISSIPRRDATPEERAPFFNQFGGLAAVADSLIERTRAEAQP